MLYFHVVYCTDAVLHTFLASETFRILQSRASIKHITCMSRKTGPNSESKAVGLNIVKNERNSLVHKKQEHSMWVPTLGYSCI